LLNLHRRHALRYTSRYRKDIHKGNTEQDQGNHDHNQVDQGDARPNAIYSTQLRANKKHDREPESETYKPEKKEYQLHT